MTSLMIHCSSNASTYSGKSSESIFLHAPTLHFFFQIPISVRRAAQENCHRPYESRPWVMSPIESRSYTLTRLHF